MDFLILFSILLLVEPILLERVYVGICLVIAFTVDTLKHMRTRFTLLYFKFWQVDFEVCLIVPTKLSMMFEFIWPITFNTFRSLCCALYKNVTYFYFQQFLYYRMPRFILAL